MAKHKHNPRGRHHRNIVGGILAAALALTIVVAAQLGGADNSQFAANITCPDGTSVPDGTMCPGGSTGGTGGTGSGWTDCGAGYWWNGSSCQSSTSGTGGTATDTQMQADCVAAGGTWQGTSSTPPCQMPGSTTGGTAGGTNCGMGYYWNGASCQTSGGTGSTTGGTATTCPSGQYWDMGTSTCKSTTTTTCPSGQYFDWGTNTCKSSTSTTTNYAVDTVGACTTRYGMDGKVGVWNAATSTCSVPMYQPYGPPGTGMGYPAGTCPNGTAYPASTTGFPPCGSMTTTTTPPAGTEAWKQTTSTSCASAGYFWGTKTNYCYSTQLEKSNAEGMMTTTTQPTYQVETVDGCKNKGGTWNASSSTCTYGTTKYGTEMTGDQWKTPADTSWDGSKTQCNFDSQFDPNTNSCQLIEGFYATFGEDQYKNWGDQMNWENGDFEYRPPQDPKRELNDLKRQGKDRLREIAQSEKEIERMTKRSGGADAASCPAIANAKSGFETARKGAELMANATEANVAEAAAARDQLFGGPGSEGIWSEIMNGMRGVGACEGLAQMRKDMGRDLGQMKKEVNRLTGEAKTQGAAIISQIEEILTNLSSYVDFSCDGPYCGDPMEEVRFQLDDLRQSFWDLMRDSHKEFKQDNVCGTFEMIKDSIEQEGDNVPENVLRKASQLLNKGFQYCEDGNMDGATRILGEMERLKGEFEGRDEFGRGGEFEDFTGFEAVDASSFMRQSLEGDMSEFGDIDIEALMAKVEERLFSKMQFAVEALVDRVTQQLAVKMAEFESRISASVMEVAAKALDNITIGFRGEIKDQIIETKNELSGAVGDFDNVVAAIEDQRVDIPAVTEDQMREIYEFATVHNFTGEAADQVKAEIDSVTTAVAAAFEEDGAEAAAEVLAEEVEAAQETIERIYEEDKDAQLDSGILPFGDLHGMENDWTFGWAAAARNEGFVNGQVVNGEKVMNAAAPTNWAEGLTMTARMVAGGEENITQDIDLSNPVIREMPDWAQPAATYLISQDFIDPAKLAEIYGNNNAGDAMTRIEMMEIVADVVNLPAGGALDFPDANRLDADAQAAAAALVDAGIVGGEGDGNLNPDGFLNRAAFAKIIIGTQQVAGMESSSFEGDFGGDFGGAGFPDPTTGEDYEPTI